MRCFFKTKGKTSVLFDSRVEDETGLLPWRTFFRYDYLEGEITGKQSICNCQVAAILKTKRSKILSQEQKNELRKT